MASAQAASRPSIFHVAILLLSLVGSAHATLYRITSNDAPVGYYLQKLNAVTPQTFVATLNTSALSAATTNSFFTSLQFRRPTIVSGVLTGRNLSSLTISTVYLGLPGFTPSGLYYIVTDGSEKYNASLVNTVISGGVLKKNSTLVVKGKLLDLGWQLRQVLSKGAIISAKALAGPALNATEVFVKLPVRVGPCPLFPTPVCDFTLTYKRNDDLCLLPAGCKDLSLVDCLRQFPTCSPGYTLHTWLGESGCSTFACDPDFIQGL